MRELAKNCISLLFSLQVQDRTAWYLQHNGITSSEMWCAYVSSFVMNTWKLLSIEDENEQHINTEASK